MENGLYIVSTPIGNLGDITLRAIETLKKSDIIICENPKHSIKLLSKFDIKKKLISLHDYNEEIIIDKIKNSLDKKKYSLISDAGSPLISDPGFKLVRFCIEHNIYVTVVPGPSSIISALQVSSIPMHNYSFYGFLPKSKKNIGDFVELLKNTAQTSVVFVSSHKLTLFLEILSKEINQRKIALCKELTKINERVIIGFPKEVLKTLNEKPKNILGEFVVVIEAHKSLKRSYDKIESEIKETISKLLEKFSLTDTVEIVHKFINIGKKELYKIALNIKNEK